MPSGIAVTTHHPNWKPSTISTRVLRLYTNFFQPVMKLVEKTRTGSRVRKKYDRARTPYSRVLESAYVTEQTKEELRQVVRRAESGEAWARDQSTAGQARWRRAAEADARQHAKLEYIPT